VELVDLHSSPNTARVIIIEENEMGGACRKYGGQEQCIQGSGGKHLREIGHLEDPGVDGRIILRWIFRKWDVGAWTGKM
jgi:hypothetical protein